MVTFHDAHFQTRVPSETLLTAEVVEWVAGGAADLAEFLGGPEFADEGVGGLWEGGEEGKDGEDGDVGDVEKGFEEHVVCMFVFEVFWKIGEIAMCVC